MKEFMCANGRVYMLPDKHCAFCKSCTDIVYDYTNGPYMFICNDGHIYDEGCDCFVGDDE